MQLKNFTKEVAYLAVAIGAYLAVGELSLAAMTLLPEWRVPISKIEVVLATAALGAAITLAYLQNRRMSWPKFGTLGQHCFFALFSVVAIGVGALHGLMDGRYVIPGDLPRPWLFLLPRLPEVVLDAFVEELLMRQVLLIAAQRATGSLLFAWVLQSVVFVLPHNIGMPWFYFAGGLWLGVARISSQSVLVSTTAHVSLNVSMYLLFGGSGVGRGLLQGGSSAYQTGATISLAILAGVVWLHHARRRPES
jgi:membrane protease YdiL (CAAX protease family)